MAEGHYIHLATRDIVPYAEPITQARPHCVCGWHGAWRTEYKEAWLEGFAHRDSLPITAESVYERLRREDP